MNLNEDHIPLVSVVLPYYNAETTLDRAIRSIVRQNMEDWELILVDNGSTDNSSRVAENHASGDLRIRLVYEPERGVVHASNTGCHIARGAYIARMDADDESLPQRLGLQSDFLNKHVDYGAVAGRVEHVGEPGSTGGFGRFVAWSNALVSYIDILNRRFIEQPLVNPSAMWRRETMLTHGLYRSGDFPEDYEMWLRWLQEGVKIGKLEEMVLKWYDSPGRLTRTHARYSDQAFYRVKSRYLAEWLEQHNPFHPSVWVWGASRISRRRARILEEYGVRITAYIDTKATRQLDQRLVYYQDLPRAGKGFILTYIRQMDNREKIRGYLEEKGYTEGRDFLMVS